MKVPQPPRRIGRWWERLRAVAGAALTIGGGAAVLGCASDLPPLDADLTPAEFFQAAQEATAQGRYDRAIGYYQTYRQRYGTDPAPDQVDRLLWADYEIAFLHHKKGDDETALLLLHELVQRYAQPQAVNYSAAPRVMAQRVIAELEGTADAPPPPAPEAES